ncbi:NlpC/P60 family peptidoglycan-binding protein RipD [Mycobacterium lepromatosis]|uniref:p60-family protein n=1 Tax=Mycobacterium lepromatosis TaxID=480418 RepID=A0A0F4EUD2_9MYCO|nr:NlpC/P60 family peptidoglycan-binding protein RipD [Mycobacterium lepromatosis]KJX75250.1 p60-family protein [Mycobacterium lepromatosis]UKN42319.1 p60-family protein [Mycobacterium lepromatosis]
MNRIYTFVIGLTLLVTSILTCSLASADSGTRPTDYQQTTDIVVRRALSQCGMPFSWAGGGVSGPTRGTGTSSKTVGFDASGLIQYAYAGAGLKLPRSSGEMYHVGQKVLPQQARKGDLIFFGPEGTESVALYLGDGRMVEVGEVVQVSPVRSNDMAPYLVRLLGAQPTAVPQAPLQSHAPPQQVPTLPAPQQTPTHRAPLQHIPLQVPLRPAPVSTER